MNHEATGGRGDDGRRRWRGRYLGGIGAPTASWLVGAPGVAMFLGGVASGVFWLVMSCAAAAIIWILPALGVTPPAPVIDMPPLHLICNLGLYVVVLVFVLLFEPTKTEGFVKLQRGHLFARPLPPGVVGAMLARQAEAATLAPA